MRITNKTKNYIIITLLVLTSAFLACENKENNNVETDYSNETSDTANVDKESSSVKKIFQKMLNEDDHTVHYFAQWDIDTNYPYDRVDDFYEDMRYGYGYFKFFYDKDGKILQHVRISHDVPERIADYEYANDGSVKISWTKNYDYSKGNYRGIDIIEYYPSGRVKKLSEYTIDENGNKKLRMKAEYSEINANEKPQKNTVRYYNGNNKEMVYSITEFQENTYADKPKYLKFKETRYIAFGENKGEWFTITRYDDTGEVVQVQENETKTKDDMILPDYIRKEFPVMFSN